jgi:P27 family predicted phage terminase small subunit
MPTKSVTQDVMKETAAGKRRGKHWTKEEIKAREEAAALVTRSKDKSINPPESLSGDGRRVWARVMASVKGISLFDNMDTELLEAYCEAVAKSRQLAKGPMSLDDTKLYQGYLRLIKSLADSLGLSPASRARLVKQKADEIQDDFGKEFD